MAKRFLVAPDAKKRGERTTQTTIPFTGRPVDVVRLLFRRCFFQGGGWWRILGVPCTRLRRNIVECQKFGGFGEVDQGGGVKKVFCHILPILSAVLSFQVVALLRVFPSREVKLLFAKGLLSVRYTSLKDGHESCGKS